MTGGSSTSSNDNTTFLRGIVATNASGLAVFQTIFPGWYAGRATHIHAKIHVPLNKSSSAETEFTNSHISHTGQVFFNDTLTNAIYRNYAPYINKDASSTDHVLTVNDRVWLDEGNSDLTQAEVQQALPRLGKGKACAKAGWPAELLRYATYQVENDDGKPVKVWLLAPLLARMLDAYLQANSSWRASLQVVHLYSQQEDCGLVGTA
ncbi:hypothetical protein WJX84_012318 [Apatococcus fuscideae]|uniref:Uncharacterized protein n=1 Tax=Apatococcus fuscideae TaxID=2026836 RepID=A0AAW1RWW8_9CHLO